MTLPAILSFALLLPAAQEPTLATAPPLQGTQAVAPAAGGAHAAIDAGLALFRKGRFRAARKEFQKAVEADPQSAAAHFYLGYALYKIGEPTKRMTPEKEEARAQFARAFELDPGFKPAFGRK